MATVLRIELGPEEGYYKKVFRRKNLKKRGDDRLDGPAIRSR